MTPYERLDREIRYLTLLYKGDDFDKVMFSILVGKINFAAECRLITAKEWKDLFTRVLPLSN